jgi:DNA mismatch endonuclease Vsr
MLGKALWKKGYRYRKNNKKVFGKPDFTFKELKIAIFCDSEFWHGKNWEVKKLEHKSNIDFWHKKIERNIERDIEVNNYLRDKGWKVLRFWGEEIEKSLDICIKKIETALNTRKNEKI